MKKNSYNLNNDEFKRNGPKRYVTETLWKLGRVSSLGISKET
jgi:hypothetical protein